MTRKYFGTDGIRGRVGGDLIHPEFALKLGWAIGRVLANGARKKVIIGKDTRVSGYLIESALEAGLCAAGVDIQLLGPMPTPAISYLTRTLRASAGIVISASHNPFYDNGMKFFSSDGLKLPDAIELEIEAELDKPLTMVDSKLLGKATRLGDAPGRYIEFCKSTVNTKINLTGWKIAVDCANGATYHIAPNVFRELGAEVIEVGVKPDGFNINTDCGSTHPERLQAIVRESKANIGIAFDGDGDRVLMVDETGATVDGDEILYVIAKHRLARSKLFGGVVGTQMTNFGLELALREMKIPFLRTNVGDRYVLEALIQHEWQLGGETSGHIVCRDKTHTGDGIIAALQVLYSMFYFDQHLSVLKRGMEKLPQIQINVPMTDAKAIAQLPKMQEVVRQVENDLKGDGRVLLRPSGTEPLLRVMVEGTDSNRVRLLAQSIADCATELMLSRKQD